MKRTTLAILICALAAFGASQFQAVASSTPGHYVKVVKGKRGPRGRVGPTGPQGVPGKDRDSRIDIVHASGVTDKATGGYCYLVGADPNPGPTPVTGATGPTYTPAHQVCVDYQPGYKEVVAYCPADSSPLSVQWSVFGAEDKVKVTNFQPNPATRSGSALFRSDDKFNTHQVSITLVCESSVLYDSWDGKISSNGGGH